MKIKRWLRRKYFLWKYKHNYGTGKLIITKPGDRQLGLTTMMLEDCIRRNYKLYVPTRMAKEILAKEIYDMYNSPTLTSSINPYDYLVTPADISSNKLRGFGNVKIIVDNQCRYENLKTIYDNGYSIENGFIFCSFAA